MKSPPTRFYVASVLLAVALFPLLLLATYVAGYFLLQDERGLFSARWQFEFYKPAVDFERWATREPVNTGYIDQLGRHRAFQLPGPNEPSPTFATPPQIPVSDSAMQR